MSDTPTPRSYPQIVGDMIDAFLSRQGIQSLRAGSPLLSLIEAAAQSDLRSSQDVFDLLNSVSLDKATGLALDRIGAEENVTKLSESPATGTVNITDTSFTKKQTKLYQGKPAPIMGSFTINVQDASLWSSTGQLYIGRGTSNYEGALSYTAKTNMTTHWAITLSQSTTKIHNVGESVIVAQGGNRVIGVGGIVKTPQANVADAIEFRTVYAATIPDGETEVQGVVIIAERPGVIGNVSANAINTFGTVPFAGAIVTNPLPFSNGRETEDNDSYRERIKNVRKTRTKGTALAITNAVAGISAVDENKRVTSASLVVRSGYPTTLYVDDGTGYEERSEGVAIEILVDSALGGEQYFQTNQRPIAKAFLLAHNDAPCLLSDGDELQVRVGPSTYVHNFDAKDFDSIDSATAYEVVASINANPNLGFFARAAGSGATVALFAKDDVNEDLAVVGGTLETFRFPSGIAYSLQLYKNDRLLVKDGYSAAYPSAVFGAWDTVSGTQTLILSIDGTPALTYSFADQDFIDVDAGYTTVGTNSLTSWAAVMNAKIGGITVTEDNGRLVLTSNAGSVTKASVEILGGSLVTSRMFSVGKVVGAGRDYTLDRNTSQIRLEKILVAGDRLSVGSSQTRSFITSTTIPATTTVTAADAWFSVDGDATRIAHGLSAATDLTISVVGVHDWGVRVKIATTTPVFANVTEGDWIVCWDANVDASLRGNFRVSEVERNSAGAVIGTFVVIERASVFVARAGHRTVALNPVTSNVQKVLTIGGYTRSQDNNMFLAVQGVTASCEIYDQNTTTSSLAANMTRSRAYHTATVLADGRVIVSGGASDGGILLASTEIYDPTTDSWTGGPDLPEAVAAHQAVKLASGDVLFLGGYHRVGGGVTYSAMACRYNVGAGTITNFSGAQLNVARAHHRAVLLADGTVLVAGGIGAGYLPLTSCEIYNASVPSSTVKASMNQPRYDFGMSMDATVPIVVGNHHSLGNRNTYETYSVGGDTWTIGQIDATKKVNFDSKELVKDSDGIVVAPWCWSEEVGALQAYVYEYTGGVWTKREDEYLTSTDAFTYYEKQWVEIHRTDLSIKNILVGVGGLNAATLKPVAQVDRYDSIANDWLAFPHHAVATSLTLSSPPGVAFVRTAEPLQRLTLVSGANYTATTLATALNRDLVGASASTYKTNRLRVSTNSYGLEGDIALVGANDVAKNLYKLPVGDAVDNLTGHMGSVESSNSEAGTPSFEEVLVLGSAKQADSTLAGSLLLNTPNVDGGMQLVGLRDHWSGPSGSYHKRFSHNLNARLKSGSLLAGSTSDDGTRFDNRNGSPSREMSTYERFFAAAPYAFGPTDDLIVQVDNDLNKRYSVNMFRRLQPVGGTYGYSNVFRDLDAGNVSLASTFGINYPFEDFTVFMKSRAVAFSGDATRSAVIRYYRPGPDGNFARVRLANPLAPDSILSVASTGTDVRVYLPGGSAKTPTIRNTTKLGVAATSTTGGLGTLAIVLGMTTTAASFLDGTDTMYLTCQLPPGVASISGLTVGSRIYLKSTDVSFPTNDYKISYVGPASGPGGTITIQVEFVTATNGSSAVSIGTVSFDSLGEAKFTGAGIVAGDMVRIQSGASTSTTYKANTFRITTVAAQYLLCTSGDVNVTAASGSMTVSDLNLSTNLKIFSVAAQTLNQVVTSVNALAGVANSTCPITMTSTGTGAGIIDRSTPDTLGGALWYDLKDGVNWVSVSTSPLNAAGDYTFSFKKPIEGTLSTGADWANEDVRIIPTTTANVVKWLNTPVVSGLYASCVIQASDGGSKVQIASRTPGSVGSVQIQGGLANSVAADVRGDTRILNGKATSTFLRSLTSGLTSNMWVAIDNANALPKETSAITSTTVLQSWTADGLVTLNQPVYSTWMEPTRVKAQFERQENFVAISVPGLDVDGSKVATVTKTIASQEYAFTVTVPDPLTSAGYQVGDVLYYDAFDSYEIVRGERANGPQQYIFDFKLTEGATATRLGAGGTFFITLNVAGAFPTGTYTVVSKTYQAASGTERVVCTNGAVGSNLVQNFGIGNASVTTAGWSTQNVTVKSVGTYDAVNKLQTITCTGATISADLTQAWVGKLRKNVSLAYLNEGDMLRISAPSVGAVGWTDKQIPVQNQGLFRIVRVQNNSTIYGRAGTIWIENPDAVEGTFESRLSAYSYESAMPGDILQVNTPLWGVDNLGEWVIDKVGVATAGSTEQYTNRYTFKVSLASRAPVAIGNPGALGTQYNLVRIIEGRPSRLVKKIAGIAPAASDGTYSEVVWQSAARMNQISAQAGSIVTALDKLDFPLDLAAGTDGYAYNTGLIGEANKIVYGDAGDTATYPGVAAAGAQININGPLVKRIKLALQIRVRTGSSTSDIADRVRSSIATAVNQTGVGIPVALSTVIAAASKVGGVVSVTMISPAANFENDLISIQPFEKPLIVNLSQDISVTFTGE